MDDMRRKVEALPAGTMRVALLRLLDPVSVVRPPLTTRGDSSGVWRPRRCCLLPSSPSLTRCVARCRRRLLPIRRRGA
jgi:hypothetical protein